MTDTDRLSTPTDLAESLSHLTEIMRDVETLPDNAQQRFWDDFTRLQIPIEDLRIGTISKRSVNILFNLLSTMCGPQLAELVSGELKESYERLIAQTQEALGGDWDTFLDQKFAEIKGTKNEGRIRVVSVELRSSSIGGGFLNRIDGVHIMKLTEIVGGKPKERYFSSKDIAAVEFAPGPAK